MLLQTKDFHLIVNLKVHVEFVHNKSRQCSNMTPLFFFWLCFFATSHETLYGVCPRLAKVLCLIREEWPFADSKKLRSTARSLLRGFPSHGWWPSSISQPPNRGGACMKSHPTWKMKGASIRIFKSCRSTSVSRFRWEWAFVYPLVMTNIAQENHHLEGICPLKELISHSYVELR